MATLEDGTISAAAAGGGGAGPGSPGVPGGDTAGGDSRRRTRSFTSADVAELASSLVGAVALTWVVFYRFAPMRGGLGFCLVAYAAFLLIYWRVTAERYDRLAGRDKVMSVVLASLAVAVAAALVSIVALVVTKGLPSLTLGFFTNDMAEIDPTQPPTDGGGLHAIVGTLQQSLIGLLLAGPLAILTAVYLNEVGGRSRFARATRFIIDSMSGLPSIVAGLFIFSAFILRGSSPSGLLGGLSLAILMFPTITRTAEEMLRLVSSGLREAALALGAPRWRVTLKVVLPTARAGLVTAVILGLARAVGETAPVLFSTFGGGVKSTVWDPTSGPQSNLPLFIYQNVQQPNANVIARSWTAALVLMMLVVTLFSLARVLGGRRRR